MPAEIACASALPGKTGKHDNCIFHLNAVLLPELNQLLLDFFNIFDSRLILTLPYDSLNLVINAFSSGLLGGMVQEKVDSAAAVALCCTHNAPVRCLLGFLFRKVMLKH